MPRVLVQLMRQLLGTGARFDRGQSSRPALGLGHCLVGHNQHVSGPEILGFCGCCDELGQVIAGTDLGQAVEGHGRQHQSLPRASRRSIPRV